MQIIDTKGAILDSTGRKTHKLHAEVGRMASLNSDRTFKCCTCKNGGLTATSYGSTPIGRTDVKISGFARDLGRGSGTS